MVVWSDNEGCIVAGKGLPFDLGALAELNQFLAASTPSLRFGICTGRSVPYVEAVVQVLGLTGSDLPCVCEGGAVLYHPRTDRWEALADAAVDAARLRSALRGMPFREELGKKVCFSAFPEPGATVVGLYERLSAAGIGDVNVTMSAAAVDVTPAGVDKAHGIQVLCERIGVRTEDAVAIGDAWNDVTMLRATGHPACPANAIDEVKAIAEYVSPDKTTRGVVDILRHYAQRLL